MVNALPAQLGEKRMCFIHQLASAKPKLKTETLLKADGAQNAGGVVDEREGVQDAHKPALEVGETAPVVVEFAIMRLIKAQGEGVDGEISAM